MRVLLLGDSISVGYGLSDDQMSFVTLIDKKYHFSFDVIARCGMTIQDLLKIDIESTYDIAIIFIGTNGSVSSKEITELVGLVHERCFNIILCTVPIVTSNNDVLASVSHTSHLILCDLNKGWKEGYFLEDNIHPNEQGHLFIYDQLSKILNQWVL